MSLRLLATLTAKVLAAWFPSLRTGAKLLFNAGWRKTAWLCLKIRQMTKYRWLTNDLQRIYKCINMFKRHADGFKEHQSLRWTLLSWVPPHLPLPLTKPVRCIFGREASPKNRKGEAMQQ
jgi:hypothetical protein